MDIEVVATDLGSLPGGGFEEQTPIFRSTQNLLDAETQDATRRTRASVFGGGQGGFLENDEKSHPSGGEEADRDTRQRA